MKISLDKEEEEEEILKQSKLTENQKYRIQESPTTKPGTNFRSSGEKSRKTGRFWLKRRALHAFRAENRSPFENTTQM